MDTIQYQLIRDINTPFRVIGRGVRYSANDWSDILGAEPSRIEQSSWFVPVKDSYDLADIAPGDSVAVNHKAVMPPWNSPDTVVNVLRVNEESFDFEYGGFYDCARTSPANITRIVSREFRK